MKESMCKIRSTHYLFVLAMLLSCITSAACGDGATATKGDIKADTTETKMSIDDLAKQYTASKTSCDSAKTSCDAAQKSCDAQTAACKGPTSTTMTKERCQQLLPWANGTFAKCGPMGNTPQASILSLDVPNPPQAGIDCIVNLTGFTINVTPLKDLHPTGWNTSNELTSFWVKSLANIYCTLQ